jgi:hypothetical protein
MEGCPSRIRSISGRTETSSRLFGRLRPPRLSCGASPPLLPVRRSNTDKALRPISGSLRPEKPYDQPLAASL